MLIFPEDSDTAHVTLTTSEQTFSAATVCLRSITDLSRTHSLFSLATSSHNNAFLLFKTGARDVIVFQVQKVSVKFEEQEYKLNQWQSICATWDSASGLAQLWLDGKPSIMRYFGGSQIDNFTTILGQEQDSVGGGFDKKQSFVGMMSDVHMWNYVLSPCEMEDYMNDQISTPGNLINWNGLNYNIDGTVMIDDKQICRDLKPKGSWKSP
ncbi:jeltraxin-like [Pseudoliparis swirei]|uniref:jeltraxin-like n=1 Tax=Pseudoliparis swirei TaxID=2059687 RepID=UPI0024BE748A|nr:jeltraxin-like [Pseudoliparis swirei]